MDFRTRVQKFGSFLSGMVIPNIGAFIAWGLITALFIPTGWIPNENLSALVGPMIVNLLPLLIGFTGGKMVYGHRGGVLGAVATMGVVVGSTIPMFLGAMLVGPLAGKLMEMVDRMFEGKVKAGFEMLVNNFSAGILGLGIALLSYLVIGPVVSWFTGLVTAGVEFLVASRLLPLASVLIEPAKVLFLNNALNHGVLGPIGVEQAETAGKSIMFLLETNPGPGLGLLLAYMFFSKSVTAKRSAPGAIIIHFFGGIHELYFPYVLMYPRTIIAVILGGMVGVLTFLVTGAGLSATPSPGSIFALLALTPPGNFFGVLAGITLSATVSFLVSMILLRSQKAEQVSLGEAVDSVSAMKGKTSHAATLTGVEEIIFACDAGMGSSAMGASLLRKKVTESGLNISVVNKSINDLSGNEKLIVTHKTLESRVKQKSPNAKVFLVDNFLDESLYDSVVSSIRS